MLLEAAKDALDSLEQLDLYEHEVGPQIVALREAIKQAEEQKPAAWGISGVDGNIYGTITNSERKTMDSKISDHYSTPLYKRAT